MANTFRWGIFCIVLLIVLTVVPVSAVTISGRVYDGPVSDERLPVSGVTVSLYCSNDAGVLGTLIMSTTTDSDGWYGVEGPESCEFYTIRGTVPRDATAVGATTLSGTVASPTTIQYTYPLSGKTLTGNKFWISTGETPPPQVTCPAGCRCMLESVADAEYDAYEQCSSEICGYDGRIPMYCFREIEVRPPGACEEGCYCNLEETAKERFGTYEKCSEEVCGWVDQTPKYCFRPVAASPATCPAGCRCMLESVAETEYDAYEQCGTEICGYDGRTPMYCYYEKDINSLSILIPFSINRLSSSGTLDRSYDLNNDGTITKEDVRIAIGNIFDARIQIQQNDTCDYPGEIASGYTKREWEKICNWDPDQDTSDFIEYIDLEYPNIKLTEAQKKAFTFDLDSLQVEYLTGVKYPSDDFAAEIFKHSWKFGDISQSANIVQDEVDLKSAPLIFRVRDMSFLPKDITSSTYQTSKPSRAVIEEEVKKGQMGISIDPQINKQIPSSQGMITTSFEPEIVQGLNDNLEKLKDDLNIPSYLRENFIIEGGYALIEGWDFGTCPSQGPLSEGDNIVCNVRLNWTVKGEEILDPKLVTSNQYRSADLLPATGDWKNSWSDYGIGVWIPPLEDLDYSTADASLEIVRTKYTCEKVLSCPQPGNCIPTGLNCTKEILGEESHPIYIVKDLPTHLFIKSDPDYSNTDIIPGGWRTNYMVAGGEVLITGNNFGNEEGTIKIELMHPIEAYSLQEPYNPLPPSSVLSDGTSIPFTITEWSDNAIRLIIGKLDVNFGGDWAMLYITKKGTATPAPIMFYFSPKWQLVMFSGEKFFNPSKNEKDHCTAEVEGNHLIVSHDPGCSSWKWSGDHGYDNLFEGKPLPPNVKMQRMTFSQVDPNTAWDEIKLGLEWAKELYDNFGETWIKLAVIAVYGAFDDNMGSYSAEIYKPDVWANYQYKGDAADTLEKILDAIENGEHLEIEWRNTCLDISPYKDKKLKYILNFWAYVPEGVDLGE